MGWWDLLITAFCFNLHFTHVPAFLELGLYQDRVYLKISSVFRQPYNGLVTHSPACLRWFPAPAHLAQIKGPLIDLWRLWWQANEVIHWFESGVFAQGNTQNPQGSGTWGTGLRNTGEDNGWMVFRDVKCSLNEVLHHWVRCPTNSRKTKELPLWSFCCIVSCGFLSSWVKLLFCVVLFFLTGWH